MQFSAAEKAALCAVATRFRITLENSRAQNRAPTPRPGQNNAQQAQDKGQAKAEACRKFQRAPAPGRPRGDITAPEDEPDVNDGDGSGYAFASVFSEDPVY